MISNLVNPPRHGDGKWKLPAVNSAGTMAAYWKLNEGTGGLGAPVADATGNGHTGTLARGNDTGFGQPPAWITRPDIIGFALDFVGTEVSKIRCGTNLRPVASSHSVACVIKPQDLSSGSNFNVLTNDVDTPSNNRGWYQTTDYTNLGHLTQVSNGVSATNLIASHDPPGMGWNTIDFFHFFEVFDDINNTITAYINGAPVAQVAVTHDLQWPTATGLQQFTIGGLATNNTAGQHMNAELHWLAVYHNAPDAAAVLAQYNEIKP